MMSTGIPLHREPSARKFVNEDPRAQPAAAGLLEDEAQIRLLPSTGGIIIFSGAQLHATVPNTSDRFRYSIDFRAVSKVDIVEDGGAPALDVRCTGAALRDFRRALDHACLSEELALRLDPSGPGDGEMVVFDPTTR